MKPIQSRVGTDAFARRSRSYPSIMTHCCYFGTWATQEKIYEPVQGQGNDSNIDKSHGATSGRARGKDERRERIQVHCSIAYSILPLRIVLVRPDQYARFNFILLTPACTRPHTKSANDSFGSGLKNRAVELVRRLRRVRAQPAICSFFVSHSKCEVRVVGSRYKRPYKCLLAY